MIPAGTYRAIADSATLTETKTGKEFIAVEFRITEGEMAGEVVPWAGWLTEKAEDRTLSSLRAMGWGGDILDLSGLDNAVDVVVKHEEYNGNTSAKVAFVNTPRKKLDPGKAAALAARLKAKAEAGKPTPDPFADP